MDSVDGAADVAAAKRRGDAIVGVAIVAAAVADAVKSGARDDPVQDRGGDGVVDRAGIGDGVVIAERDGGNAADETAGGGGADARDVPAAWQTPISPSMHLW